MRPSFRIVATGVCVPHCVMTNEDIERDLNPAIDPLWVEQTLGIRQRYVAESHVQTSDLGAAAAAETLARARVDKNSVDLLILATFSPDKRAPATACLVSEKAGLSNAVAFDVSAVCSGFLFALTAASAMLNAGPYRRALVVGADIFSRVTDWQRRDCVFFGDGAGAILVEATPRRNVFFDAELYTDSTRHDAFTINGHHDAFDMNGPGVFQAASQAVPACIDRLLRRNRMTPAGRGHCCSAPALAQSPQGNYRSRGDPLRTFSPRSLSE